MKKVVLWFAVIAAAGALAWYALWSQQSGPVAIRTAKVERRDIVASFVADGIVRTREAHVSSKIVGRLSAIFVAEGERVAAGTLLARLDSGELESAVRAARGELGVAKAMREQARAALSLSEKQRDARVRQAKAQLAASEADLQRILAGARPQEIEAARQAVAEAEARSEAAAKAEERARSLYEQGALPKAALERAEAELEVATAQLEAARQRADLLLAGARPEEREVARQRVEVARAEFKAAEALSEEIRVRRHEVDSAQARIAAADGLLRQAQAALASVELRAPIDGAVQDIPAELGEMVTPQTPAIVIVGSGEPWVEVEIADQDAGKVFVGQQVGITAAAFPGRRFAGEVSEISPHAELKPDIALRTRIVRAKVRLLEGIAELRPGLEVDVEGESVAAKDALTIPNDALALLEDQTAVYVVEDGTAWLRSVKTGHATADLAEILDGLREGETVAVSGKDLLSDGRRVSVEGEGRATR
jgi:HlyD family secretion protein